MKRFLIAGAAAAALLPLSAGAKPVATKQANMAGGVRSVSDAASGKQTVYGAILSLTFTKADAGKMLELAVESPKPVTIELWSGDILRGAATWDKGRQFLGTSGKAPEAKPTFKWMVEPGNYSALVLTTLPAGAKPDPFTISWGKELRVPTAQDKAEWDKAIAKITVARIEQARAKRPYAPNFSTFAVDRNPISAQQYRGKVVLIHFYAGSAEDVMNDIGYNDGVYAKLKDQGFELIEVCLDTEQTGFDAIQAQFDPKWRQIYDGTTGNAAIAEKYGVQESMQNVLIDTAGKIVARDLHREALARMVVATINEGKSYKEAVRLLDESPEQPDPDDAKPAATPK